MTREQLHNLLLFVLVVMCCGGGCMSMRYMPAQQEDLAIVGLDDHTRARLEGLADPRPSDAEPTRGLTGKLGVLPLPLFRGMYGRGADLTPSDKAFERLSALDGVERAVSIRFDMSELIKQTSAVDGVLPESIAIDFKKMVLDQAKKSGINMLLIYTAGHNAKAFDLTLGLGQILLLGFCPSVVASGDATMQAVLMDVQTGYIYALTSGGGDGAAVGIGWDREQTKSEAASGACEEAFDEIVDRFEEAWPALQAIHPPGDIIRR